MVMIINWLKSLIAAIIVSTGTVGPLPALGSGNHLDQTMSVLVPLVAKWEGLSLTPYYDIVGVRTWCYGETEGTPKAQYTKAECDTMLRTRLLEYHNRLLPAFTQDTQDKRLPPKRHAAFDSLSYNVGTYGASRSTAVRRLNNGDVVGACNAIGWWNKAGGRVVRGLVNRRSEETKLCLEGT